MEPIDYGGVLLRRWWLPVVMGVICAVAAVLLIPGASKPSDAKSSPSSWKWSSDAIVGSPPPTAKSLSGLGGELTTQQIVFYAQEPSVIEAAAKAAGINEPRSALRVNAIGPAKKTPNFGQVVLLTDGPTAAKAAAFSNAYAKAVGSYINGLVSSKQQAQLQQAQHTINNLKWEIAANGSKVPASLTTQLASAQADEQTILASSVTTGYQILKPATASQAVSSGGGKLVAGATSSKKVRLLGGFVLGLILGAGIVLISALLDKRLRNSSRAANNFGFPVVAEIPLSSRKNGECDISALSLPNASDSPVAEAYQMLRMAVVLEDLAGELVYDAGHSEGQQLGSTTIGVANSDEAVRPVSEPINTRQVVLVVSPGEETARPIVVANLAASYARAGLRVLVMSTLDIRSNEVAGAARNLAQDVTSVNLAVRVQPTLVENVSSLSLSEFVVNSAQLVNRAPGIIRAARDLADIVIVEAPPVLAYHDTEALSQAVDVVLVVGDCVETKLDRAKQAGELLRRMNAPVLGVVITSVEIGTRDIRHLVSVRPGSKGVEEPLEGVLEPAAHASVANRDPETLEHSGIGNDNEKEGETSPDRVPATLEHATNGNSHTNGEGKEQASVPDRELVTLEHATNGHANGNGGEKAAVPDLVPATNGHATGNGNGKAAVPDLVPATNGHATGNGHANGDGHATGNENGHATGNGNGHATGNGNGKAAVPDLVPATNGHATGNGNGDGDGDGKEQVSVPDRELEHSGTGNDTEIEGETGPDRVPATLEHATNGNENGNGTEVETSSDRVPATTGNGNGKAAVPDLVPATNGHATGNGHANGDGHATGNGNGHATGNGNGKAAVPDLVPATNGHSTGNGKENAAVPDLVPAALESAKRDKGSGKEGQSVRSRLRSIFRGSEPGTLEQSENGKAAVADRVTAGHGNGNGKENVPVHQEFATLEQSENGNGKEQVPAPDAEPATLEHAKNGNGSGKEEATVSDGEPPSLEHMKKGNRKESQTALSRLWSIFL
jgi:Mrp family chromosome partitioning ATPase